MPHSFRFIRIRVLLAAIVPIIAGACSDFLGSAAPRVGDVVWRQAAVTDPHYWYGMPATDGERVFFDVESSVVAFDARTGRQLWSTRIRDWHTAESRGIVHHGSLLVIVAEQLDITALDAVTGAIRWRARVDTSLHQSPGALDDRAFYGGDRMATVYALDRDNGSVLWRTWLGANWVNGNVLGHAVSGDTVFAGGWFRTVTTMKPYRLFIVALDRHSGRELWRYETPESPLSRASESPLILTGELVLAADNFGRGILALDRRTGTPRWFARTDSLWGGPDHPPTVMGDALYFGSGDGSVYSADVSTGGVRWQANVGSSPMTVGACGDFVFANNLAGVILDRASGGHRRTIMNRDDEVLTSNFVAVGRRIFASGNKAVYAFRC